MSLVTIVWSVAGGISLAFAMLNIGVWVRQREARANLLFAVASLGAAGSALIDLSSFHARTIEEMAWRLRIGHAPVFLLVVGLVWFVRMYLGAGRVWLAWTVTAGWVVTLGINLVAPDSILFGEITSVEQVALPWGESFARALGPAHPLKALPDVITLVWLGFVADAAWTSWRRGRRRRALAVGGSTIFFLGAVGVHTPLADRALLDMPPLITLAFLGIIVANGLELSRDVVRTTSLSREVASNERRWRSLLENVRLLVVGMDREGRIDYVNPFTCEVTGFAPEEMIGRPAGEGSSPELRDTYRARLEARLAGSTPADPVTPVQTKTGSERLVAWSTVRLIDAVGEPTGILTIGADVTEQRRAEEQRDGALRSTEAALAEVQELKRRLEEEVVQLKQEIRTAGHFEEIIGDSDALQYVLQRVEQVAPLDTTVLIEGETGVGKELIARAIHARSLRKNHSLVKVDCTALPPNLIEAELFGHEKGAFTGADRLRRGRFELADRGTLFLDEVGELPLELQGKLLRVLQDGEFERVGAERPRKVDVRLIAATNRKLSEEVSAGRFRRDLYYRLHVFPLTVPALRQRTEDIPLLAKTLAQRIGRAQSKPINSIPQPVMNELKSYDWPGNVRELENVIERAVITSSGGVLRLASRLTPGMRSETPAGNGYRGTLSEVEREYILSVLTLSDWRIEGNGGAAERLGLHANTLRFRMKKLGIERPAATGRAQAERDSGPARG